MRYIKRLNKLLWIVNLALAVVFFAVALKIVAPGPAARDDVRVPSPLGASNGGQTVADQVGRERSDPKLIVERDIFGAGPSAEPTGPVQSKTSEAVKVITEATRELPFRLLGTVALDSGDSYAVLEHLETKTQDIYRVGDSIDDARIDAIEQNRVVVLNAGVRQVVDLLLTDRPSAPARAVNRSRGAAQPANPDKMVRVAATGERQINRRASASALSGAAQSFLSKMELSPHVVDGKSTGLRVSGLEDSLMSRLVGLKDGDVIQSVNGHMVPNQRKAIQVLRKARKLGSARLQLTRGQEKKSLTFGTGSW